jgi:ferritin-like metal-binding protein YciE
MAGTKLQEKLVDYIQDAFAMEQSMSQMLDSMISTTRDAEMMARLREHKQETARHAQRMRERLNAFGRSTSITGELAAVASAVVQGVTGELRADKPAKNARDGYIAEQTEIAAYELLERLAYRAGDTETARMAHLNLVDEQEMARWIVARWEKFVDLTLTDAGLPLREPAVVG